jgi:hypothetical protein
MKYIIEIETVGDGDIFNTELMMSITTHGEDRVILEDCYVVNNLKVIDDSPIQPFVNLN